MEPYAYLNENLAPGYVVKDEAGSEPIQAELLEDEEDVDDDDEDETKPYAIGSKRPKRSLKELRQEIGDQAVYKRIYKLLVQAEISPSESPEFLTNLAHLIYEGEYPPKSNRGAVAKEEKLVAQLSTLSTEDLQRILQKAGVAA